MIEMSLSLIGQEVKNNIAENSIALGHGTNNTRIHFYSIEQEKSIADIDMRHIIRQRLRFEYRLGTVSSNHLPL